jgi:copper oxidase (laccase) domain-containing protein
MIDRDQPTCFPSSIVVGVSSRRDGTMLDRTNGERHGAIVVDRRRRFVESLGMRYENCVYQIISYGAGRTYDVVKEVTRPCTTGHHADVLYTRSRGIALFLPIADCVATVIYDTKFHALALAHLGRHASIAQTMAKTVDYFIEHGSNPNDLVIWMAPSVGAAQYRMEYFDEKDTDAWRDFAHQREDGIYLDLKGYNRQLAINKGVLPEHIVISPINTAIDPNYFSHSQGDISGRFAVVCCMV